MGIKKLGYIHEGLKGSNETNWVMLSSLTIVFSIPLHFATQISSNATLMALNIMSQVYKQMLLAFTQYQGNTF